MIVANIVRAIQPGATALAQCYLRVWGSGDASSSDMDGAGVADQATESANALLVQVVYELLDAHADTQQLATRLNSDPAWSAHLNYLSQLQRTGREALATAIRDSEHVQ